MTEHFSNLSVHLPKKKLVLCVFNRATYARCKTLIQELARYQNIDLTIVLSSSLLMKEFGDAAKQYIVHDLNNIHFELLDIGSVDSSHLGSCLASANILSVFSTYFDRVKPDGVLVVADRFETLPAAMAASYLNIPVIHLQGGEVTGNIDDRVRHAITKLSDYHFVCTTLAKQYVIAMGEDFHRVFHTGCPSIDLISKNYINRERPKEKYILCIFHPETENAGEAYNQTKLVLECVLHFCLQYGYRCYWYYPNPDPGREAIKDLLDETLKENPDFLVKAINKDPIVFLKQLAGARFVIGNSSCGIRECSYLGVPAINVGDRQGKRERAGNVVDAGYDKTEILNAITYQFDIQKYVTSRLFGGGRAGEYIAKYIAKLDLTRKDTLTYPFMPQYRESHFGKDRFKNQGKYPSKPYESKRTQTQLEATSS